MYYNYINMMKKSQYKALYIGGGFDVLHPFHKLYILQSILIFTKNYGIPSKVVIGVLADKFLNSLKGAIRPFFSNNWRKKDMAKFLKNLDINFEIIEDEDKYLSELNKKEVVIVYSKKSKADSKKKKGFKAIFIPAKDNSIHTSSIEEALLETKGAVLVRDGVVIEKSSLEIDCLKKSKKGDYFFTINSPSMTLAKKISLKGIKRLVYLNKSKDLKPLNFLKSKKILFRQAGI